MRHARNDNFLATSKATESSLLLGSHEWVVHNDSVKCTKEGVQTYKANLTLHACDLESFACANAFCVPMEKRCNAKEDCADGSDEQDCGGLIKSQGYMKELTPHMGPEDPSNRKKIPIFFVDAKCLQIVRGFQKCKS